MKPFKSSIPIAIVAAGWLLVTLFSCQEDDRGIVVGKIQSASDMVTTEFTVDKVVFGTKTKNLMWFKLSEAQFLAYSQARVKTGINLANLTEQDILITGKKIELVLPPVEVINFSYPPSSFVEDSLISDTRAFLNKISLEDQEEFFRLAELDIRNSLQYMGLVKTTQDHTRQMFNLLLESLGYEEIYIRFKSNELIIRKVNLNGTEAAPS